MQLIDFKEYNKSFLLKRIGASNGVSQGEVCPPSGRFFSTLLIKSRPINR
jgi:hypothetical protein